MLRNQRQWIKLCCTWVVYATGWACTILKVTSPCHYNFHNCTQNFLLPIKDYGKNNFLFTLSFLYLYFLPSFLSCCLPIPLTYESYYQSSLPSFFPSSLPTLKHLFFHSFISFLLLSPSLISHVSLSHPFYLLILLSPLLSL
jgi:hypothetical protein